jgi:WD40 repeat protein
MAIHLHCPSCRGEHQLAEHLAGQVVRCRKCQAHFRVPAAPQQPAFPPAVRQRSRHEKDDQAAPSRKGPVVLLVALAGVAGLLVLGWTAVVLVIAFWPKTQPAAPPTGEAAARPEPQPGKPQPDGGAPTTASPSAPGSLPPDPLPAPVVLPDDKHVSIRLPSPVDLLFPTTASPFVAIAGNAGERNVTRTVWDLRDGRQTGTVTVDGEQYQLFALSPDGAYLAATVKEEPWQTVEVWSVADGRSVRRIDAREPGYGVLYRCDFAGAGLLLTNQSGPQDNLVRIWDVTTGKCVRRFEAPVGVLGINVRALSPGRRYLASVHRKSDRLVICDLGAGKVVADWRIPDPNPLGYKVPWAVAFSEDGRSLYLLYICGLEMYLATWDVSTGHAAGTHRIASIEALNNPLFSGMTNTGPLLDGLSDGKVLLAGYAVVDPKSGAVVRKIPQPTFQGDVRRVFGTKWARTTGAEGDRQLVVQPFPPP